MSSMTDQCGKRLTVFLVFILSVVVFTGFSGISVANAESKDLIRTTVTASIGGSFSDDPNSPSITITIPPGALSSDAELRVKTVHRPPAVGENQTAASHAFDIKLTKNSGSESKNRGGRLELVQPMKIAIAADTAPAHPQLGEIAQRSKGKNKWQRMQANFFRASDTTAVTTTTHTKGTFRVVHRTLQARTGPEVERGRDLYFNETWGDEAFWGDVFKLHEVLNVVSPVDAVGIGAQVDLTKVPQPIVDVMLSDDFAAKQAALNDPAITQVLIKAGAVLGVKGFFDDPGNPNRLTSVGLTCALCHVTVTPTPFQLAPPPAEPVPLPIGIPVLGPPNTTIDAGLLLSFTPRVQNDTPDLIPQYQSWGPGHFDPRFFANNPFNDFVNNPSAIPQHWNYVDLAEQGYAVTWIGVLQSRPDNNSLGSAPECGIDFVLGVDGAWGTDNRIPEKYRNC